MILESVCVGLMQVNCYILAVEEGHPAIIIDPGAEPHKINKVLAKFKLKPALVINTHGHYDHIGADDKFGAPIYAHESDLALLRDAQLNLSGFFSIPYTVHSQIRALKDKEIIASDGIELEVLHLPGHTQGGIGLLLKKPQGRVVFTGDTLFCQGVGRTDLAGGDEGALIKSIKEKLLVLPDDTLIYPGHGASSTIGRERGNFK